MGSTVSNAVLVGKGHSPDPADPCEDKGLDPMPRLLRDSIAEADWKHEAVAEHIGLKGESGATYFSKMLAGEKPIGARHLQALPAEVGAIFARRHAEMFGFIVVKPLHGEDAARSFVGGLFGILTGRETRLPAKAEQMARAVAADRGSKRRRA